MCFKILFGVFVILSLGSKAEYVGDDCEPNSELSEGTCTVITDCEVAVSSIRNKNYHNFKRCGFDGENEVVCCPDPKNKFGETSDPDRKSQTKTRIADVECQKIVNSSIPPIGLYIIGGETASLGEFPHMVAIGYNRDLGYVFDCGGSLISTSFVMTAAHCVQTQDRIEPSVVRAGVVEIGENTWNEQTDYRIAEIKVHPSYKKKEKYHDIALLRLEKPVDVSSELNAACLYTEEEDPSTALTVTGWGVTSNTRNTKSNVLLKANVSVVERSSCGESYTNQRKLPDGISHDQLCAGDPQGKKDACQGDSGGPLQAITTRDGLYRLVGITSFGRGCGSPVPGVYTRVSRYIDWIESVVWRN